MSDACMMIHGEVMYFAELEETDYEMFVPVTIEEEA